MNKKHMLLIILCAITLTLKPTTVWIHNDYSKPIVVKRNGIEATIGHGNRIPLGNAESSIQSLAIKTTVKGSLYHNIIKKISEIQSMIANNPSLRTRDVLLTVNPNTVVWSISITWQNANEQATWTAAGNKHKPLNSDENYMNAMKQEKQKNVEAISAFFRTSSEKQIMQSIQEGLLGSMTGVKILLICQTNYKRAEQNNLKNLCADIYNNIATIKTNIGGIQNNSQAQQKVFELLIQTIDESYTMLQKYKAANIVD